jgi:response regulator RpfG family c-di-GMP phosphodiesterase
MSMHADDKTTEAPPRVLCVDDEPGVRSALRRELHGYAVEQAESAAHARTLLEQSAPDVIICDLRMPDEDGIHLLSWVAERHPQVVRILLTGYGDYQSSRRAINSGRVFALLEKPWDREELRETIRAGLEVQRQAQEQGDLEAQFAGSGGADLSACLPLLESLTQLELHQPGHSLRVAELLEAFGRSLKLNDERTRELRAAALAHGLGELSLPDA